MNKAMNNNYMIYRTKKIAVERRKIFGLEKISFWKEPTVGLR